MTEWDGKTERRTDDTNVRLALLEAAKEQQEKNVEENKLSLISVHKRVTEVKDKQAELVHVFAEELRIGLENLALKMDEQKAARDKERKEYQEKKDADCKTCQDKVTVLQTNHGWIYGWLIATWTAISALTGLFFYHNDKMGKMLK